jgi:hypothetical protein
MAVGTVRKDGRDVCMRACQEKTLRSIFVLYTRCEWRRGNTLGIPVPARDEIGGEAVNVLAYLYFARDVIGEEAVPVFAYRYGTRSCDWRR